MIAEIILPILVGMGASAVVPLLKAAADFIRIRKEKEVTIELRKPDGSVEIYNISDLRNEDVNKILASFAAKNNGQQ